MHLGTFSLKSETLTMVLNDIFENLHQFGFDQMYCINQHGDAMHVSTIINSIKTSNEKYNMNIRILMETYDLYLYGLSGKENFIMLDNAEYSPELFDENDIDEKDFNAMLHNNKDMPRFQIITDQKSIEKYGESKMYFAPPIDYDKVMKKLSV